MAETGEHRQDFNSEGGLAGNQFADLTLDKPNDVLA